MKSLSRNLSLVFSILMAKSVFSAEPVAPAPPAGGTNGVGPKIQFAGTVYDFGKVSAGEMVKHEFVFTNTGDALLEITAVSPGCGCTTAGPWTRQVEPGKTGIVPLEFNSTHFSGPVAKMATVNCSDKGQPSVMLQIKGTVSKPLDVSPQTAVLNVVAGSLSNATAVVRIVNNQEQPMTLSEPESNNRAFAADLKTIQPGKEFQLIIKTVPPLAPGNVQGRITLKTSLTNSPLIEVNALAEVQPAVSLTPSQIVLPSSPNSNTMMHVITIRNNDAKPLALSEPAVNAKGVDVQMRESEPGRQFVITLTFTPGFEIAPGHNLEFSVKSSNPQFPVIKVPFIFMARPSPPKVPVRHLSPAPPANVPAPPP
jgi:hypothetical protein